MSDEPAMPNVLTLARELRAALAAWEPGVHSGDDCAAIVEELARTENASAAARARGAARVAASRSHRARGFADAHDWLASVSGSTTRDARASIEAVRGATACPDTNAAWVAGDISSAQAAEIVRTVAEAPGTEAEMLDTARGASLGATRERGRKRRLEVIDPEDLHVRQQVAREFRHWRDDLEMVCGSFRLPPAEGVRLVNRLERGTDRRQRAAKRAGHPEPRGALAADELVALTRGEGIAAGGADLVIVQDARVARRGHVHPGEACHIVGGGPIAPSEVERLAAIAFVKSVLHDGERVTHVAHYGRKLTAAQRTARGIGPPPEFDGRRCAEAGCERRLGLETDHVVPFAQGGPTSGENLLDRCLPHHWEKTERDRRAARAGRAPP